MNGNGWFKAEAKKEEEHKNTEDVCVNIFFGTSRE